jgi:hypothetical protein
MIKVKDTIVAGVLAGWMGNVVKETLTWSFHFMGWVRYTFVHIAAGFYYSVENLNAPLSLVTGAITDWTIAGTFGTMLLLLLRYTGVDYAIFKGIGFGALVYVITFGIGMAMDITRASLLTPLPDFLLLMSHLAIGGVSGWALGKYFSPVINIQQGGDILQKKNKQFNPSPEFSKTIENNERKMKFIKPIKLISNRKKRR